VQLLPLDPTWYVADGKAGPEIITLPAAQLLTLLGGLWEESAFKGVTERRFLVLNKSIMWKGGTIH